MIFDWLYFMRSKCSLAGDRPDSRAIVTCLARSFLPLDASISSKSLLVSCTYFGTRLHLKEKRKCQRRVEPRPRGNIALVATELGKDHDRTCRAATSGRSSSAFSFSAAKEHTYSLNTPTRSRTHARTRSQVPAGHHELDEPGIDVNMPGMLKFWPWVLFESRMDGLLDSMIVRSVLHAL